MDDTELRTAIAFARLELLELEHGKRALQDCPGVENVAKMLAMAKAHVKHRSPDEYVLELRPRT